MVIDLNVKLYKSRHFINLKLVIDNSVKEMHKHREDPKKTEELTTNLASIIVKLIQKLDHKVQNTFEEYNR